MLISETSMEEVEKDELCEEEAWLLFYSAKFISLDDCMHHCEKFGGRSPSISNQAVWIKQMLFLNLTFYSKGHAGYLWLPVTDEEEEGVWKDYNTHKVMGFTGPFTGTGPNGGDQQNCVQQATEDK